MKNKELEKTLAHLSKDPILASLIKLYPVEISKREVNLLEDLVSAIISQQLSVKAADTIYHRFLALYDNKFPEPDKIIATDDETLRGCGISYAKIRYLKGIATAVVNKEVDLLSLPALSDEDVINELVKLKGVGQWTAEMFLMFSLARPDVFSFGDLGLRNAIAKHYSVDREDRPALEKIVAPWQPYRTYAARLLWQSLDNKPK